MNTQQPDRSLPEIARFRRIGFLVYPDCEILDVCGPFEAFYLRGPLVRTVRENERSPATNPLSWRPLPDLSGPCPEWRSSRLTV